MLLSLGTLNLDGFAQINGKYLQGFAVFRDRSARYDNTLLAENI
jgi:hypothetical protein